MGDLRRCARLLQLKRGARMVGMQRRLRGIGGKNIRGFGFHFRKEKGADNIWKRIWLM